MSEFTEEHLAALNEALASGATTVEVDGRRITYRSVEELEQARNTVKRSLSGGGRGITRVRTRYSRGI